MKIFYKNYSYSRQIFHFQGEWSHHACQVYWSFPDPSSEMDAITEHNAQKMEEKKSGAQILSA